MTNVRAPSFDADLCVSTVFPFPCIRGHHFVKLASNKVPVYTEIVEAGKKGDTIYIDIGCCSKLNRATFSDSMQLIGSSGY